MKASIITFFLTVLFSIIMLSMNYKVSGGDIFSKMMILGFALIEVIVLAILRAFYKFNFFKATLGILLGLAVSYVLFEIINNFSTQ
jgi:bacteriorhodopsin